jgi:O-antigen/teichoic acid export membrane protein
MPDAVSRPPDIEMTDLSTSDSEPASGAAVQRGSYGSGLGLGTFSFLGNALLALAASVAIARLYGVTVVGQFALAAAPAGAVWLLSTVREQPALMRRLTPLPPRDARVTGLFAAVLTFSFVLTAVVSAIAGALTWVVFNGPIDHPDLIFPAEVMLGASLLFVNTCWNLDTVLGAFRAGRPLLLCRLHQAVLYLVLAIALRALTADIWALVIAWYGSWASSLIQRVASCRTFMRLRVSRNELAQGFSTLPELLRFGLKLTPGYLAEGVSDESSTWILGALVSVPALGAFNRAWMLARRGLELNYRVTEMLFPTLVERHLGDDRAGFDRALVDSLRYVAIGMLLPAAAAAGAAAPIMSIYGPGFASGAGALAFVVFVPGVVTLSAVQSYALIAEERGLLVSMYGIARVAVTLLATVPLTRAYGVSGTGAGLLIGACAQLLPLGARLPRLLHGAVWELWRPRDLASLLACGVLAFAVSRSLSAALPRLPALVLAPTLGLSAAAALLLVLGATQPRDRERIRRVVRALSARGSLALGRTRARGSSGSA